MIFHQLFERETSTYTYLLADEQSGEAVLIDPVLETVDRDLKLIAELGVRLKYVLDTHIHADHITGAGKIREHTGAKTCVSRNANVNCVDIALEDGQELRFGAQTLRALATPGHTDSCMSFVVGDRVFTGDALLIRGTGRTDFQQGSAERLYDSIHQKLFSLPPQTQLYPAHDYRGQTASTIDLERRHNPRVGAGRTKEDFVKIMSELKLDDPKKIHEAVPANLACGKIQTKGNSMRTQIIDGIPEVTPDQLHEHLERLKSSPKDRPRLIDVRRPDEFTGELGHVPGAELVTLGADLDRFLAEGDRQQEIVFICRSGGRSGRATAQSQALGYDRTANMTGGMIRWNELKLKVER